MNASDTGAVLRDAMLAALTCGGPVLAVALAVGLVMSVVQAATQINEQTLVFVPKLLAVCVTLALLGPFVLSTLTDFARAMFDRVVAAGG